MADLSLFCSSMSQTAASVKTFQLIGFEQLGQFVLVKHYLSDTCTSLDNKRLVVVIDNDSYLVKIAAVDCALNYIRVEMPCPAFLPRETRDCHTLDTFYRKSATWTYMSVYARWQSYLYTDFHYLSATFDYCVNRNVQVIACRIFHTLLWHPASAQNN